MKAPSKIKGFTLIELIVASAVLLVLLTAYLSSFSNVLKVAEYNQGLVVASEACRAKLEEISSHDFGAIPHDYGPGGTPGNTWTINIGGVFPVTGRGSITVTDQPNLYGGGWTIATASAAWPGRYDYSSVVYDNKMWVMAGVGLYNDVWYSSNGVNWTQATSAAAWKYRCSASVVVYDNKMWLIGGDDWGWVGYLNDIWYSSDGTSWIKVTPTTFWSSRAYHRAVVYDNKMWVMGGISWEGLLYNDVWYSTNGVNWTQATAHANWPARYEPFCLVYDNKMWVIGGNGGYYMNDVWYSTNGVNWTQATAHADWTVREDPFCLVYDNKMWVIGGYSLTLGEAMNDVWYSTDGAHWTQAAAHADWPVRAALSCLVYNNKMWGMGGYGVDYLSDVWYSSGYNRLLDVRIALCWRQRDGRIFGEDTNLNGVLDPGEDKSKPPNGLIDSPVVLRVLLSEKNMPGLNKLFLGR